MAALLERISLGHFDPVEWNAGSGTCAGRSISSRGGCFRMSGVERRGEIWIAPEGPVPLGSLVDPDRTRFWVSWQHETEGLLGDVDIVGAEAAIEWGRERSEVIRIRLGSYANTYFSAGDERVDDLPLWPPEEPSPGEWWSPPPGGWWPPQDGTENANRRIGVLKPEIRRDPE